MLKGPRITLRAITRNDLPRYVTWLNDVEVIRHLTTNFAPFNLDDETDWYENQRKDQSTKNFTIDNEAGKHIGSISLMNIDHRHQQAELGIVIGEKNAWNKGYCTEAITLLLKYGFNTLNLNRIFLRVDEDSWGGLKCYERCGFVKEGELRQAVFREGAFISHYIMSVLRSEWESEQVSR